MMFYKSVLQNQTRNNKSHKNPSINSPHPCVMSELIRAAGGMYFTHKSPSSLALKRCASSLRVVAALFSSYQLLPLPENPLSLRSCRLTRVQICFQLQAPTQPARLRCLAQVVLSVSTLSTLSVSKSSS